MKAKVLSYEPSPFDYCMCEMEDGSRKRIDLVSDGSFGEMSPTELVGKTVEFERTHAYLSIAHGVRIVDEGGQS